MLKGKPRTRIGAKSARVGVEFKLNYKSWIDAWKSDLKTIQEKETKACRSFLTTNPFTFNFVRHPAADREALENLSHAKIIINVE